MGMGNPEFPVGGLAVRPPAGVELRPPGRDDLRVAVHLAREAEGLPPGDEDGIGPERFETMLNDPDVIPFLALRDGDALGIGVLRLRRRLNFATFEGWIEVLHARTGSPEGVREALGRALVAEWELRQGHRLLMEVPDGDVEGEQLGTALGMEAWMLNFRLAPVASVADGVAGGSPPDGVMIRPLATGDGDAVTRLVAEFGSQRSPVPDRMDAVLRTFAGHVRAVELGRAASLVAELDGVVVGVCTLEWRAPFWDTRLTAWIPDLVVTEPMRGRGIGRALLDATIAVALRRGAAEVVLESGPNRMTAHALYLARGFKEVGRTWVRRRE